MITVSISGDESDQRVIAAAQWALRQIGAKRSIASWGVGGSQELTSEEWRCGPARLTLEGETYIGLTLNGPEELVNRVARLVASRLGGQ